MTEVNIRQAAAPRSDHPKNSASQLPPQELLNEYFGYDPETGRLWRKRGGSGFRAGDDCGNVMPSGHIRVKFKNRLYLAHRLIYRMVYGIDPGAMQVDHINRDGGDNRICNLRLATQSQNLQNSNKYKNNKTGFYGVHYHKLTKRFTAQIQADKKPRHIGLFPCPILAAIAYDKAALDLHGEFASFNFPNGWRQSA
jgi:hypothetical protein